MADKEPTYLTIGTKEEFLRGYDYKYTYHCKIDVYLRKRQRLVSRKGVPRIEDGRRSVVRL